MQNTLYIAAPIFSERLLKFDAEATFPPIKKIGITSDHPARRERELLGTMSPIKVSIVKAWTGVSARAIETMLHTILDNTRLDGEYFWDGNETLVDAVSGFIASYHPEAIEIHINDDQDVKAASDAADRSKTQRVLIEVAPKLDELGIKHRANRNGRGVRFALGDYRLALGGRSGGRYTLTIWSQNRSTEDALRDFPGAQELSANSSEDSTRRARISMANLDDVIESIAAFVHAHGTSSVVSEPFLNDSEE